MLQPERPPRQLSVPALQAVAGFFSDSPGAIRAAITACADLLTEVRRPDYPHRRADGTWAWPQGGLFGDGWAFVVCAPHTHPALPAVTITQIPVPPRRERPFVDGLAATMVDPWIGPLNESWRALVSAVGRERRLIELCAPAVILEHEAERVQQLIDAVWAATRTPPPPPSPVVAAVAGALVPPLDHVPGELDEWAALDMHGIAALETGGFVIQEPARVRIVDATGELRCELPPAGCKLAATHGTLAVFHGYFAATHPSLADDSGFGDDHVHIDDEGVRRVAAACDELTVLDTSAERYLAEAPAGLPGRYLEHGEPEDLLLGGQRIDVGGDRPGVLAYATGLAHAWIGEAEDTRIIDLATAIPHVVPTPPTGAVATLDVETRQRSDPADEEACPDEPGGCAIVFARGRWLLLWPNGTIADHRGTPVVRLSPAPRAAAFSADGRTLACLLPEGRLAVVEI